MTRHLVTILAVVMVMLGLSARAEAQSVSVSASLSDTQAYVGQQVVLVIRVNNTDDIVRPAAPDVEGLTITAAQATNRSESSFSINGRTSSLVTNSLSYVIVPTRAGVFILPPMTVKAGGQEFTTRALELRVEAIAESDELIAEIQSDQSQAYVGQLVKLTLKVWVKQYADTQLGVKLDEGSMWRLIDEEGTGWGSFQDAVVQRPRSPFEDPHVPGREARHANADGAMADYYVYEFPIQVWPEHEGPLAVDVPRITMDYPKRLEVGRDLLGRQNLRLADSKRTQAMAKMPEIAVKTAPKEGQPETYTGAVGQFDFDVKASPTDAAVGDPITLTATVTDVSRNGTRMELVQPPALERVEELTKEFRMPTDPLAGTVNGTRKVFTQTIRAKNDVVNEVPAIPFTYFDPEIEKYVTKQSRPVELKIRKAANMNMMDVVGGGAERSETEQTELTQTAGGLVANIVDPAALLAKQRPVSKWAVGAMMAVPPLAYLSMLGFVAIRKRENADPAGQRRAGAAREARAGLAKAKRAASAEQAAMAAGAIRDYVADKVNVARGTLTREEVVEALRARGVEEAVIAEVDGVLERGESQRYAGFTGSDERSACERAERAIESLEREGLK